MGPLVALLITKSPEIITLAKQWFAEAHPELPVPTSEEVLAAWLLAAANSIAIDDEWLANH